MRDLVKVEKTALINTAIGEYNLSTKFAKKVQEYINSTALESLDKDNITCLAETPDKGQMEVNTEMQKEISYIKLSHFRILNKVVLKNTHFLKPLFFTLPNKGNPTMINKI